MKKQKSHQNEKNHYIVNDDFSARQFNQTDFGGIYFNIPSETKEPESIEELAKTLEHYNKQNTPVTIRNTGHSVNGQTLTSGVQINLAGIKHIEFDQKNMNVTVGAGVDWDTLFQTISFPKYCPPMFPNNPGQTIHVTGNASVGGVGFSSAKVGGLWNHVQRLTLVTMEGHIIQCSPTENPDYFRYALGGHGRIGVIADITITVEPSKSHIIGLGLLYHNLEELRDQIDVAIDDPIISSVATVQFVSGGILEKVFTDMGALALIIDVDQKANLDEITGHIKRTFDEDLLFGYQFQDNPRDVVEVDLIHKIVPKRNLVYCYPESTHDHHLDLAHPWTDPNVPDEKFPDLVRGCNEIVNKYGMGQYLRKQTKLDEIDHIPSYISYLTKKTKLEEEGFFPLSLTFKDAKKYSIGIAIEAAVPSKEVDRATEMINEINDFTYSIGGRNYLFSYHNLTKDQIIQHYGLETIKVWNSIKNKLDPKHLLNNAVIEHLDEL